MKSTTCIALADDDADEHLLFRIALDEASVMCDFVEFNNGEELLARLITSWKPDLVFLDLNMPVCDGFETLGKIRSDETIARLPVIVYSTSSSSGDILRAYMAGANGYLLKSYADVNFAHILPGLLYKFKDGKRLPLTEFVINIKNLTAL